MGYVALPIRQLPHKVFYPRRGFGFILENLLFDIVPFVAYAVVVACKIFEEACAPRALYKLVVGFPTEDVLFPLQSIVKGTGDAQASVAHKQSELKHLPIQLQGHPCVDNHLNYLLQQYNRLLPLKI